MADDSNDRVWERIVETYNRAKNLQVLAEELDPKFETCIAALFQHRDTLDHLVRGKASELGLVSKDPDHSNRNLERALGHSYRAFFEVADWLSILLRARIQTELEGFSPEAIKTALPQYYGVWRPRILEISGEIAKFRTAKDVSNAEAIIPEVPKYHAAVEELLGFMKVVQNSRESLEELRAEEKKQRWYSIGRQVLLAVVSALVGAAVTTLLT